MKYFETEFLDPANKFVAELELKAANKVLYNIEKAEQTNDPKLFKKLNKDIWEFRIRYAGQQIRLLAFWDKTNEKKTLVVATHRFIKKVDQVPENKIKRATSIRIKYFENKEK